jgi:hypothetical protein
VLSTGGSDSAKIPVITKDQGHKLGHTEAQDIPSVATGADYPAAAITPRVALRGLSGEFPAGPDRRAESLAHPDSYQGQGSPRPEGV